MHATYESSTLSDNYLRIDLHSPSAMDDAAAVDSLVEQGTMLANHFSAELDTLC